MWTIKIFSALMVFILFTACQTESFNPVDSSYDEQTLNKADGQLSVKLYPYDNKEPNASASIDYTINGKLTFALRGHKLLKNTNYALCYGNIVVAYGTSNGGGNLNLRGSTDRRIYSDRIFSLWYADDNGNLLSPVPSEGKVLIDGFRGKDLK
jgi:hypothetical protein